MKGWLFGAACLACAVVMAVFHMANPRVEVRTQERVMPARPTLEQFRRNLDRLKTVKTAYQLVGDVPMRCAYSDSTFDPEQETGIVWLVQWCYRVPLDEAVAAGAVSG